MYVVASRKQYHILHCLVCDGQAQSDVWRLAESVRDPSRVMTKPAKLQMTTAFIAYCSLALQLNCHI